MAWEGITVGGTPQRVTKLQLTYKGLDGSVPPELGGLEKMEWLFLYGNRLTGTIPAALGALGELEVLYLQNNQLTGPTPPELGALSSLRWLGLHENGLTGQIPVELASLPALQDLWLTNNQLTGPIPAGLVDRNLSVLFLTGNSGLTGCIPVGLRNIQNEDLDTLGLSDCTTTTTYLLTTTAGTGGRISLCPARSPLSRRHERDRDRHARPLPQRGGLGRRLQRHGRDLRPDDGRRQDGERHLRAPDTHPDGDSDGGRQRQPVRDDDQYGGAEVTLTASWNDATHTFTGWGGACTGTATTCVLTMDATKTVAATFAAPLRRVRRPRPGRRGRRSVATSWRTPWPAASASVSATPPQPTPLSWSQRDWGRRPGGAGVPAQLWLVVRCRPTCPTWIRRIEASQRKWIRQRLSCPLPPPSFTCIGISIGWPSSS